METSEDDIDEIQREIAILSGCNDPHITKYHGCFVKGHKLWISMIILNFIKIFIWTNHFFLFSYGIFRWWIWVRSPSVRTI